MSSSGIRTVLVLGAVGALLACAAGVSGLLTAESRLEGRTVRSWLRQYETECCFSSGNDARGVFYRSGTNALPGLVRIFNEKPPFPAQAIMNYHWSGHYVPSGFENWARQKEELWESDRFWATLLCADLGVGAKRAHEVLIAACRDSDSRIRREAARLLCKVELPPEVAVPILSKLMMRDSSCEVRSMAAGSLGELGLKAEVAVPALRQATNDAYAGTRAWAREALKRVENASAQIKHHSDGPPSCASPRGITTACSGCEPAVWVSQKPGTLWRLARTADGGRSACSIPRVIRQSNAHMTETWQWACALRRTVVS